METGTTAPTQSKNSLEDYYKDLQQAILDHVERGKPWRPPVKPADCVEDEALEFPLPLPPPPPDWEMDADCFGLQPTDDDPELQPIDYGTFQEGELKAAERLLAILQGQCQAEADAIDAPKHASEYHAQVRRMQKAKAQADAWVADHASMRRLEPYQPTMPPETPGSSPEEDHSLDDPPELPGLSAWLAAMDYDYGKLQKAILDHIEKGKPWPPFSAATADR